MKLNIILKGALKDRAQIRAQIKPYLWVPIKAAVQHHLKKLLKQQQQMVLQ